jgi:hypothetical protein
MNLLEPLVAGVVLFIALFSSLQINASNSQWSIDQASRQELNSAADASMLASQAIASKLAQSSGSGIAIADCKKAADTLAQEINNVSVAMIVDGSVKREATVIEKREETVTEKDEETVAEKDEETVAEKDEKTIIYYFVSVTVTAKGLAPRRRWLSPAAYGLCGSSPPPLATAALGLP